MFTPQYGEWQTMYHALFNVVYDHQGGPRGGDKTFASGMFMGMAQRPLGDGTLGLRAMLSPDPFMGANGYPLLLATGETANGRTPLIDRQHPHDLFMELATTYSYNITKNSSVFLYAGLPGEPALGPPAFMHRTSGMDIPEAPITHHWLDSTHITFGVVTAGVVLDTWKVEASAFKGREPDQYRYDIEAPQLDSFSGRVSWNPIRELSLQASWGRLHSPEQLEPGQKRRPLHRLGDLYAALRQGQRVEHHGRVGPQDEQARQYAGRLSPRDRRHLSEDLHDLRPRRAGAGG